MKLVAEPITLPDNASWQDIEDAKLSAKWHEVKSREYLMSLTNLDGKCGSCKNFKYCKDNVHGFCRKKYELANYRARYNRACKEYERKED